MALPSTRGRPRASRPVGWLGPPGEACPRGAHRGCAVTSAGRSLRRGRSARRRAQAIAAAATARSTSVSTTFGDGEVAALADVEFGDSRDQGRLERVAGAHGVGDLHRASGGMPPLALDEPLRAGRPVRDDHERRARIRPRLGDLASSDARMEQPEVLVADLHEVCRRDEAHDPGAPKRDVRPDVEADVRVEGQPPPPGLPLEQVEKRVADRLGHERAGAGMEPPDVQAERGEIADADRAVGGPVAVEGVDGLPVGSEVHDRQRRGPGGAEKVRPRSAPFERASRPPPERIGGKAREQGRPLPEAREAARHVDRRAPGMRLEHEAAPPLDGEQIHGRLATDHEHHAAAPRKSGARPWRSSLDGVVIRPFPAHRASRPCFSSRRRLPFTASSLSRGARDPRSRPASTLALLGGARASRTRRGPAARPEPASLERTRPYAFRYRRSASRAPSAQIVRSHAAKLRAKRSSRPRSP